MSRSVRDVVANLRAREQYARERQARAQEALVPAPDPTDDPEGRALVQAIHDRKAQA